MLIGAAEDQGRHFLIMGLSRENVDRMVAGNPIRVSQETHGNAVPGGLTIVLCFGETEAELAKQWKVVGMVDDQTPVKPMPKPEQG